MLQTAKAKHVLLLFSVLVGCASNPPGDINTFPTQRDKELVNQAIDDSRPAVQHVRDLERDYHSRPKKRFVAGQSAGEFQTYVTECLQKIQRIGTANYPDEARGQLYGSVVVTFSLARNGQLEQVVVERSSGHRVLDDAIIKAIKMSAPFAAVPQDSPERFDQLVVTQRFAFVKN